MPTDFLGRIVYLLERYGTSYLRGAGVTMVIALVGTVIGCIIGFVAGLVQTIPVSRQDSALKRTVMWILKLILNIYVEVFRGTPMMAQAMFIYFGSSAVFNINMSMWFAAFFIVSINTGAYMAETVRGGIFVHRRRTDRGSQSHWYDTCPDHDVRDFAAGTAKYYAADWQQPDH